MLALSAAEALQVAARGSRARMVRPEHALEDRQRAGPKLASSIRSALSKAVLAPARSPVRALNIPRARCRAHAETFSWQRCALQFLANLSPAVAPLAAAAE